MEIAWLNNLLTTNYLLSFVTIFIAGIVSSFSPCTLSVLPLIIGYVSNKDNKNNSSLKYSIFFSLGIIITYTIIGVISVLVGNIFLKLGNVWYIILSIILIFTSLYFFGVIKPKNENACKIPKFKKNALMAFFIGILGGIFATPCSTPVLLFITTLISTTGNILYGSLLMFVYSLGLVVILIIAGTSVGVINSMVNSEKYKKIGNIFKIILGIVSLILALYMIYNIV